MASEFTEYTSADPETLAASWEQHLTHEVRWPDGDLYTDADGVSRFTVGRARVIAQHIGGTDAVVVYGRLSLPRLSLERPMASAVDLVSNGRECQFVGEVIVIARGDGAMVQPGFVSQ